MVYTINETNEFYINYKNLHLTEIIYKLVNMSFQISNFNSIHTKTIYFIQISITS